MKSIENRCFILIRPKKSFIDWVNKYDNKKIPYESIASAKTLYMIDELDDISEAGISKYMSKKYKPIFINELFSWYTNENYFPKDMSFDLFREWMEYEFIEMCFDTLKSKIDLE